MLLAMLVSLSHVLSANAVTAATSEGPTAPTSNDVYANDIFLNYLTTAQIQSSKFFKKEFSNVLARASDADRIYLADKKNQGPYRSVQLKSYGTETYVYINHTMAFSFTYESLPSPRFKMLGEEIIIQDKNYAKSITDYFRQKKQSSKSGKSSAFYQLLLISIDKAFARSGDIIEVERDLANAMILYGVTEERFRVENRGSLMKKYQQLTGFDPAQESKKKLNSESSDSAMSVFENFLKANGFEAGHSFFTEADAVKVQDIKCESQPSLKGKIDINQKPFDFEIKGEKILLTSAEGHQFEFEVQKNLSWPAAEKILNKRTTAHRFLTETGALLSEHWKYHEASLTDNNPPEEFQFIHFPLTKGSLAEWTADVYPEDEVVKAQNEVDRFIEEFKTTYDMKEELQIDFKRGRFLNPPVNATKEDMKIFKDELVKKMNYAAELRKKFYQFDMQLQGEFLKRYQMATTLHKCCGNNVCKAMMAKRNFNLQPADQKNDGAQGNATDKPGQL